MLLRMTPRLDDLLIVTPHPSGQLPADVLREMLPFYVPLAVALLLVTYWPDLSLWLPRMLK
jgi:TRAP-type C4-dicarboxylate transport system permease large subunit